MVRTPPRVLLATWTLVAMIAINVGPVVNAAWAEVSGQGDDHACCPEKIGQSAPAGRSAGGPLPCCTIGNAGSPAPLGAPLPVRSSTSLEQPVLAASWSQSFAPRADAGPNTHATLGPIPLVIRTSVLLI